MKRSSLLVRMVISIFLVFLILLAVVGTFYYQSSSSAIEATIEGNSQTTISQTSHFIQSYIKKLETTSTSLTQQKDVLAYAENPSQDQTKGIRDLFLTILKADQDLKTVVLVTKSGQVISTDDSVQMKTSSDMMAEDWYQKAIHQGAKPVLTPARKSDSQWVISVTQDLLMKREPILVCFVWIFPTKLWKPILTNSSWASRALPLSSMKTMNLSTILNVLSIAQRVKWRP